MVEIIAKLQRSIKVDCPPFIPDGIVYECIMGSHAYGCQDPSKSDYDYYGVAIPPREYIYVHEAGYIPGFDTNIPTFEQFQKQFESQEKIQYDINIYNIIKYFKLAIGGSPNILDSLYVPINYVTYITKVGTLIRDNRHLFLSKKLWHTYKGYAFAQASKVKNKKYENSKRKADVDKYGFSTKECYHLVRLMSEIKQLLTEETMDLQRDREHYKAIRRGEIPLQDILKWFEEQERSLEQVYLASKLPYTPRYDDVREILLACLEEFYGTVPNVVKKEVDNNLLMDLNNLVKKYS